MAKNVKSLSGPAKDAYIDRVVLATPGLPHDAVRQVGERIKSELTRVWVRVEALAEDAGSADGDTAEVAESAVDGPTTCDDFDPFTPNVIVVVRTAGRDGARAALAAIRSAERLRVLAREQQLGIDPELVAADEIRSAIITAAERRIANRRAAAS